ncbi:MAG TPA: hypothetical protein VHS96_04300 [Bacteroidia bacterium]|nr:hypothetical protein [Bacteroidia bacterium]
MKISTTLLQTMLITATIGLSTACTTKKAQSDTKTKVDRHEPLRVDGENCPACGRG